MTHILFPLLLADPNDRLAIASGSFHQYPNCSKQATANRATAHNGCPDDGRTSPDQHCIEGDTNQGYPD